MKIGEFAELNRVTCKMLRHYDEIGLLKPSAIDDATGYRYYEEKQSNYLNWIIVLKNLDFSLVEIKEMLSGLLTSSRIILELKRKRIEISSSLNEQIQKKVGIDKLIEILEKEGFQVDKQVDLLDVSQESIHEIKKNMPNMEMFLDAVYDKVSSYEKDRMISFFRFDICHFKQVNDDHGYEVGDKVIVACYNVIRSNVEKYLKDGVTGRAHGDEFIVFAGADKAETEMAARAIFKDLDAFDFNGLGCEKQIGGYVGGAACRLDSNPGMREMIDRTIELIADAHKKGRNSILVEVYER